MNSALKEIYLASDHAGMTLKAVIIDHLRDIGMMPHDLGYNGDGKADYPDYAETLAQNMKSVPDSAGVLVCGSGIGISIAANRFPWIRAALCHDVTTAKLARQHNNANVIAIGERLIGETTALAAIDVFLNTEFEAGRHSGRVDKLSALKG
ncbi:MAG: ribose 5-phosphate isomerase B [Alphaproteobacteria bacterium]|nr:ribose 5-phosphate isomerase B [Alphaproteobacteria bacterium]